MTDDLGTRPAAPDAHPPGASVVFEHVTKRYDTSSSRSRGGQ